MKELLNDLIQRSGLSKIAFASKIGISANFLAKKKRNKTISMPELIIYAKNVDIDFVQGETKDYKITIEIK